MTSAPRSVERTLATYQLAGFVLVLGVIGWFQFRAITVEVEGEVENTGRTLSQVIEEVAISNPHLLDTDTIQPIVFRVAASVPNVDRVSVIDRSLHIIADSDVGMVGQVTEQNALIRALREAVNESWRYTRGGVPYYRLIRSLHGPYDPVAQTCIVGALAVDMSLGIADARVTRVFVFTLASWTLALSALWVVQHWAVRRRVVAPLRALEAATERLAAGDLGARAAVIRRDEVGRVGETFNAMAATLAARTRDLERANRELTEFAYVVSHDLRAPLRGINTLASWLAADHGDALGAEGKEQLALLVGRVARLDALINGILAYSRAGRLHEETAEVDAGELVHETVDLLDPPAHVAVRIAPGLPTLRGERTRLQQVFQNLIGNAIKFADKPRGEVRIDCAANGRAWRFSVADNGPGIEAKHFERIFQMFQTLEARDERESTGIGLALVKKLVEQGGGRVWVESTVGEGSTFHFTVPREDSAGRENEDALPSSAPDLPLPAVSAGRGPG